MNLIKENIEKNRKVYKLDDRYRKVWQCKPNYSPDKDSLEEQLEGPEDNWEPKPGGRGSLFNTKDDFYQNI